ncbi:MAG: type II toxin-antitoxin system prevent-host-death family antitoxin [Caulobacter sp.]|nr:type II toxin-antitoxin system prevent-host-death family antitoxin [Caulobacter sp.]
MEIGVFEARNRFSELIEAAERGEEVIVLRRGKPVARITSAEPTGAAADHRRDVIRRAAELADRVAERMGRDFTHEELIAARDFGRR